MRSMDNSGAAEKLIKTMGLKIERTYYWTDSELVLSWIMNDESYKTFVGNRVAIVRKTKKEDWKYINTKSNPADLISRGVLPEVLINSDLWWHGPEFLRQPEDKWPTIKPAFVREPAEERLIKTVLTVAVKDESILDQIDHKNSIKYLQRVVAYILRFGLPSKETKGIPLSIAEMKEAMTRIVKHAQKQCFKEEFKLIKKGQGDKTKFTMFTPIIDADGIIRVGGRIENANIPFEQKHPILLPKVHYVTKLIMENVHINNKHAGAQALLAITRQRYWPEAGKKLAEDIVKQCVSCTRSKPILMEQVMGSLPADRINIARPFVNVGLDFAGPIEIHYKIRGQRVTKAYVCAFVCFATKAVHLEPAANLKIDGFINCLKRFIARRGAPKKISSDNATNFRGTNNQLVELAEMMDNDENKKVIYNYCRDNEIKWQFVPARSPHFNGLILGYIKLVDYWAQQTSIKTLVDHMDEICPQLQHHEHCDIVRKHARQQYKAIMGRNELFRSFSQKTLSRKRRGWANFIGTALNAVTGVMDDNDAQKIQRQMKAMSRVNSHLMQLIGNQTSIQDMTQRILKREETNMSKQLTAIKNSLVNIQNKDFGEKERLFTTLSLESKAMINIHSEVQSALLDLISHTHHGKVSSKLIAPAELKESLAKVAANKSSELMLPGDNNPHDIAKMYSLLEAKVRINPDAILLKIAVPLLYRDVFNLHHIIPVPFLQEHQLKLITTKYQYIGVNTRQDRYYLMTTLQKTECKEFSDDFTICNQDSILYNTQHGNANCEMAILTQASISPRCAMKEIRPYQVWSRLITPNQFIYAVPNKTMLNIICKDSSVVCSINGLGIIAIPPQCMIQMENMEISSKNTYSSELPIVIAPSINISDVMQNAHESRNINSTMLLSYQINPELDALELAVQQQRAAETISPTIEWHHIHHYTLIYMAITGVAVIILWMVVQQFKAKGRKYLNATPIPAPRKLPPIPEIKVELDDIKFP